MVETPEAFSKDYVYNVIRKCKNGKTSGIDALTYEAIKKSEILKEIVTDIVNGCLRYGKVPRNWRYSELSLIYKNGDINDINSYRPICLSGVLYKIYMACLANWITENIKFKLPQKGFLKYEG